MRWWGRFLFGGDRLPLLFLDKPARTALGSMARDVSFEKLIIMSPA
jgi:hypothetical protein